MASWRDTGQGAMEHLQGGFARYRQSGVHQKGMEWLRGGFGVHGGFRDEIGGLFTKGQRLGSAGRLAGRALGVGFAAWEMYHGYQQEGVWGATKAGVSYGAWSYGLGAGIKALGVSAGWLWPVAVGAAIVGGGVFLNTQAAEGGERFAKRHRQVDFGGPTEDRYGTIATMRRRSIMALNRSRISGGQGLGNEALNSYIPYNR